MLTNIPDKTKESRGLCKPPIWFLGSRRGTTEWDVFSRKPCEHQFWNSNMLVAAEL